MKFEPINQKASVVVTNYNFINFESFFSELQVKKIAEQYELIISKVKISGDMPTDESFIRGLQSILPSKLKSKNTNIDLTFIFGEGKLIISKDNFNLENDFSNLQSLSEDLIDLKTSDIFAIGINFTSEFNLKKVKLQLLNKAVQDIEDFEKNMTFQFILPLEYREENLIATYKIQKVKGGNNSGEDRIYQIDVNFHFDLHLLKTGEKDKKIKAVLNADYYNRFLDKCQKFLSLNDEKKD